MEPLFPQAGAVDREARVSVGRAGTMMAAIRTKFEVALKRSRFPESDWTVVGTAAYLLTAPSQQLADMPAPPPPNKAGGCWKELPKTLAKKKAIWNPQNEDHLRPCPLPRNRRAQQAPAVKGHKLLSPRIAPPGLAARSGRRGGGLLRPADGPPRGLQRHRCLRAPQVEVFVFVWQQTLCGVLPRPPAARRGTGVVQRTVLLLLHSGHYSLIHNFQALASRRGTLGATPTNAGGCKEHKCPRRMARFTKKASWQRRRATQCYR